MKKILLKAAVLLMLSCACANAADNPNIVQFGGIKVQLSLEASPGVLRTGGTGGAYASGGVSFINKRWLVVHVSFVPGVIPLKRMTKNQGNQKGVLALSGRWIDDVTMRVRVAIPTANARRANATYGILEGKSLFWTMRLDGKRHTATMFVPPQLLDRYAPPAINGRKEVALVLSDYKVLVEFTDSKGNFLGRATGQTGNKNQETVSFFDALVNTPGTMVIKDAVLPKNKSPWAWHMSTTFDYLKDTGAGSSSGK